MKKEYIDPFIKILPVIDLHCESKDSAVWLLADFIKMNLKMKKYKLAVIHGKGYGIVRRGVHEYLSKDKRVKKYYIYGSNDGLTIVELKTDSESER